jgi:phage-related tail protein
LSNTNLVVLTSLTGGTGLRTNYPYYVVGVSGNDFQLSETSGGAAVDFTSTITDATVVKLTEISGGSPAYARVAIAFAAAALGVLDDSTNGAAINVPAGGVVDYTGYFSAISGGTCYGVDDVTQETFAGQGVYTNTDSKLNLNG